MASVKANSLAAQLLRTGQVVAIPTETVYGLAADATNPAAVQRIFEAKGRPQDNPLIVHIAGQEMLAQVVAAWPPAAKRLADAFWPGPLTLVLPRAGGIAPAVGAGLATVGVRMPAHPVALDIIARAGVPLAAPSANRSGRPSPTTAAHVLQDMAGRIPLVVDGGNSPVGVESTVVSLAGKPTVLRPGFVTPAELSEALGQEVALAPSVQGPAEESGPVESPGVKYRHYAPKAKLTLVEGPLPAFAAFVAVKSTETPGVYAMCFTGEEKTLAVPAVPYGAEDDPKTQAAGLFAALRQLDEAGAQQVYARMPAGGGVGLAVRNRLLRAAQFRVESET
ncbi:threonylcarbamoyl-AMP synthase [Ruminococcaceae bacterium OttesenSCG-928-O06]|nr:threonylcarbamoyl-AMP synthase [Ruminococcaceae bacterium OttesenSCG-928-O06]